MGASRDLCRRGSARAAMIGVAATRAASGVVTTAASKAASRVASRVAIAAAVAVGLAGPAMALGVAWGTPAGAHGTITTIAGGIGGPGLARSTSIAPCGRSTLRLACGLAFRAGKVYFTDTTGQSLSAGVVRTLSMKGGKLTTPVGDGFSNLAGDGGPARQAGISRPSDVSFDHSGNMLISDASSVRVLAATSATFYGQPMTAGHISTVAGGGGSSQNGVPATSAAIKPCGAIVDAAGNIVICGSSSIRVVAVRSGTFYGQPMTAGDIYTVAGGGSSVTDGGPATSARVLPLAVVIDAHGNLLVSDSGNSNRVRLIAAATGTFYGQAMTAGDIYTVAGGGDSLREKVPASQTSMFPAGLTIDKHGNIVVADFRDNLVRVVAVRPGRFYGQAMKAGDIYALAGGGTGIRNGVGATSAKLGHPLAVTTDSAGNVIVANQGYQLHVIAVRSGGFYGVHLSAGHLYSVAGNGQPWSAGGGGPAVKAQIFANGPVTYDRGNLVTFGWHPTKHSLHTKIRLVPGRSGRFFGHAMRAGHIYVIAGGDQSSPPKFPIAATKASFGVIGGLAADGHGNLLISDRFRVDVLAAQTGTFYGQHMKTGFLYKIAGNGRVIDSGDGGLATRAGINAGTISVDSQGNVILATVARIRVVAARTGNFYGVAMTAHHIYTIAGNGTEGTGGDGGPALRAQLTTERGLALDGKDGLVFSDENRLRMIATATGTFFGVPMTAGDIYTIAGTGSASPTSGDGVPASTANITPELLTVDPAGNLVFYDQSVNKLRMVPASDGSFYGTAMTADDLYSIVGGGNGSLADGGPGTKASIDFFVEGFAQGQGGIAYADQNGIRVRFVTR